MNSLKDKTNSLKDKINSLTDTNTLYASRLWDDQIIIFPREYSEKRFMCLKVLSYDLSLSNHFVAKIITHRTEALTQQTINRRVSLDWIVKFVKHNEKRAKDFISIHQEKEAEILKNKKTKFEIEIQRQNNVRDFQRSIEQKGKSSEAKSLRDKEIRDRKAIKQRQEIDAITSKIKKEANKTKMPESNQLTRKYNICGNCGGDGGVNQGCYKCDGTGWI